MNTAIAFDTLDYVNRLKAAQVPEQQAEATAQALRDAFSIRDQALDALERKVDAQETRARHDAEKAASKNDLAVLDTKTERGLAEVRKEMALLEKKVDVGFAEVRGDIKLLKWMLTFVLAGTVSIMFKLFFGG